MYPENVIVTRLEGEDTKLKEVLERAMKDRLPLEEAPWLNWNSLTIKWDSDCRCVNTLRDGSPGKRLLIAAARAAQEELSQDVMRHAALAVAKALASPLGLRIRQIAETTRLDLHPDPEEPAENSWEFLCLPIHQQLQIELSDFVSCASSSLSYSYQHAEMQERNLADSLVRLSDLRTDVGRLDLLGGHSPESRYDLRLNEYDHRMARELQEAAWRPERKSSPSWLIPDWRCDSKFPGRECCSWRSNAPATAGVRTTGKKWLAN